MGSMMLESGSGELRAPLSLLAGFHDWEYQYDVVVSVSAAGSTDACGSAPGHAEMHVYWFQLPGPGHIRAFLVPDDDNVLEVDATRWPEDCRALEVWITFTTWTGRRTRVSLPDEHELVWGHGSVSGPTSLLAGIVPDQEPDVEAHTSEYDETGDPVTGPADVCDGVATTVLVLPEGWSSPAPESSVATTTTEQETSPSGSESAAPTVPPTLPGTGSSRATVALLAMTILGGGLVMVSVRHRSTS